MTREEILNMPAGRNADKLIGIHIFDLMDMEFEYIKQCPVCGNQDLWVGKYRSRCGNCNEWVNSPYKAYTEDLAAAWEVVEKMPDGYELRLHQHKLMKECWQAEFHEPGTENYMVLAATAPLAICRAALMVVMETENDRQA